MEEQKAAKTKSKLRGAGFSDQVESARAAVRKSKLIGVHCTPRLVGALEEYIVKDGDEISRPEAIRRILRRYLRDAGLYR